MHPASIPVRSVRLVVAAASLLLLSVPLLPGVARAADSGDAEPAASVAVEEHVSLTVGRVFARQRARIDMHLQPEGRFAGISDESRATVSKLLDRMQEILDSAPSIEALEPEQRAELINTQSHVNVLLTQAREDSREDCRRMAVVGSRFKKTVCQTVAEWRLQAEASQEAMRLKQVSRQRAPAGG